jgi:hypothetical protein
MHKFQAFGIDAAIAEFASEIVWVDLFFLFFRFCCSLLQLSLLLDKVFGLKAHRQNHFALWHW